MVRFTKNSSSLLLLIALGLATVMTIVLAANNTFLQRLLEGTLSGVEIALVMLTLSAGTGALIVAFSAAIKPESKRLQMTGAASAIALLVGVETSHAIHDLPINFHFAVSWLGHVIFVYCYLSVIVGLFRLQGSWISRPPVIAALVTVAYGLVGFLAKQFIPLDSFLNSVFLLRSVLVFLTPWVVLIAATVYRPLRLDSSSWSRSFRMRLPSSDQEDTPRHVLTLCMAGAAIDLVLAGILLKLLPEATALSSFAFSWLGFVSMSLTAITAYNQDQQHSVTAARLATTSAQRFLRRNLIKQQSWAATVGLKTTSFHIDHDPNGNLVQKLPASLLQIRAEEIRRCVLEILGSAHLHSNALGQRLYGAIDPEVSIHSCVDALKMFATLYLDAGPLVERRIKGLASLLPIVDPGLAKVLAPIDLDQMIRRNQWFFFFDFEWIDQHVIHTPRATRYDVRVGLLSSQTRQSMINHLEKTGSIGNYVWLGPDARDRLIQEAPMLRHIIEACPVASNNQDDELLMFVIKFEHLIPRLQRYFDLESMRKSILDFEPSLENSRLLNLFGLQISKARTPQEILEILASISSYPWKGFREKDLALQLIQQAYNELCHKVAAGNPLYASKDGSHKAIYDRILEAIRQIGYPAQILHAAQQKKIALRDIVKLCDAASHPQDSRFHEAWLMMSTIDFGRYPPEQRWLLYDFLKVVPDRSELAQQRLVQIKAIDAIAGLGRTAPDDEHPRLLDVLNHLGLWFAQVQVDPEICCLLLDSYSFLKQSRASSIEFSSNTVDHIERYRRSLEKTLGPTDPKLIALNSRWHDIRNKSSPTKSSAEVAA